MSRPVIGIAMQTLEPIPGKLTACWVMGQRYVRVLASSGAIPWLVPPLEKDEAGLRAIHDRLDGLFLVGGVDIDPGCYGEERHPLCDHSDPARDWAELTLIRWALAERKPVLGICRGIQAINVACGGTLHQDITALCPHAIKHDYFSHSGSGHSRDYLAHAVRIEAGSRLAGILAIEHCQVNSLHHQSIKRLGAGLSATRFAPDGLIEGVEMRDRYLVGVQWHPEELVESQAPMRRLFADFIAAAQPAGS